MAQDLVLNIRKPIGWTSFDVVRLVKNRLPKMAVGHAGTLDPFAQGVLLVCTGKATKQISQLVDAEKEYHAGIRLGIETDTLDISGKIVAMRPLPQLNWQQLQQTADSFVGKIKQVPPRFSALKKDGKRWYALARSGDLHSPEERTVEIKAFEIIDLEEKLVHVRVLCGKGVYIRSLVRDFAVALGTVGFTSYLVRTRIGGFELRSSMEVTDIAKRFSS